MTSDSSADQPYPPLSALTARSGDDRHRVLVVDDDSAVATLLRRLLTKDGGGRHRPSRRTSGRSPSMMRSTCFGARWSWDGGVTIRSRSSSPFVKDGRRLDTFAIPADHTALRAGLIDGWFRARQRLATRLQASQQRQLAPLPVAVDVDVSNLAEPGELRLHVQQPVRWIFCLRCHLQQR